ncbi:MAG: hypothetical protein OHK0015_38550 [Chloroflexi bacterium OHK40]
MPFQVMIEDHTGNISHAAKMVENVPIARLLPAIVSALGLPIIDSTGRSMAYSIRHHDRELQDDDTLETAGVAQGDTLTIVPAMFAGGGWQVPFPSIGDVGLNNSSPRNPWDPITMLQRILESQALSSTVRDEIDRLLDVISREYSQFQQRYSHDSQSATPDNTPHVDVPRGQQDDTHSTQGIQAEENPAPQSFPYRPLDHALLMITHLAPTTLNVHVPGVMLPPQGTTWRPQPEEWSAELASLAVMIEQEQAMAEDERRAKRRRWRTKTKILGKRLFRDLQATPFETALQNILSAQRIVDRRHAPVCFRAPREFLAIPYELLHDQTGYLALRLPLYHQVTDFAPSPTQSFARLVRQLQREGTPLHMLLLDDDHHESIGNTARVEETIRHNSAIRVEIVRASGLDCISALRDRALYHLVHFEGQAIHDAELPDDSHFDLGSEARISAAQLAQWLEHKGTSLLYINGWTGADIGRSDTLIANQYYSLIDAALSAGVAHVVGFRWPPPVAGRAILTAAFYQHLFADPFAPEVALYEARRVVAQEPLGDLTWMSSLLVSQHSYLTATSDIDWQLF